MPLSINTNMAALQSRQAMKNSAQKMEIAQRQLSTGSRVSDPTFDPSSASVGLVFDSHMSVTSQGSRNAIQGSSMIQMTAENVSETSSLCSRLLTLATQSNTNAVGTNERAMMNLEFQSILNQIDKNSQMKWGASGIQPLYGDGTGANNYSFSIQADLGHTASNPTSTPAVVGNMIEFNIASTSLTSLGLNGLDITSQTNAQNAQTAIETAMGTLSNTIATLGSKKNQLDCAVEINTINIQGMSGAKATFTDTDISEALSNFESAKSQMGLSMAAFQNSGVIPNQLSQLAASMLRG